MRWCAAILVAAVLIPSGCAYQNAIYNARATFEQAERDRRAGEGPQASLGYSTIVRRLSDAYRSDSDAEWAGEALLLLGRAHTRLGNLREGRAALVEAEGRVPEQSRYEWSVALADVLTAMGRREEALAHADMALRQQALGGSDAEAHLIRGRLHLGSGERDRGLWDLERASESRAVRTDAALARVAWAVTSGGLDDAVDGAELLFSYSEAGARFDSLTLLVDRGAERWGAGGALQMLAEASRSSWNRSDEGAARLVRARWLQASGDSAAARAVVADVAQGVGSASPQARLLLGAWMLRLASNLTDLEEPRRVFAPVSTHPVAAPLLDAIDRVGAYAAVGFDEPLGWFAAAEVARDDLQAPILARGLFLAYADGAHEQPWAAKAILAAIELSADEDDRDWLRSRLETYPDSPYVLAAQGNPTTGFQALEEDLALRLSGIRQ